MARKKTTRTTTKAKAAGAQFDLEALGLVLLALGVLVLGLLLPIVPTGDFGAGVRTVASKSIGAGAYALPWPLLVLGGLFMLRHNPPAWPRILSGYLLLTGGIWTFMVLFDSAAAGAWGQALGRLLAGASGVLGVAAAVLLVTVGIELIINWPPTTIIRVGVIRLIEFLRLAVRAGVTARNRAKAHAEFHADVVQERLKLRDLDRDLQVLAGLYPGSSEVEQWRQAVLGASTELRSIETDKFEDVRLDVVAWQGAVQAFTRERAQDLGVILAAEGLPGFDDWWREIRADLDEAVSEPVTPARTLDELRKSLVLGATALNERYRSLKRERDLAEPALRNIKPRELAKASELHDERLVQYRAVKDDAAELHELVGLFGPWRAHMVEVFQAMAEYGSDAEVKDYSNTLSEEIREKGRDILQQLEGWQAALAAVTERARQTEQERAERLQLASEKAVEERIRHLAADTIPPAHAISESATAVLRYPREVPAATHLDASSPSRRLAAELRAAVEARSGQSSEATPPTDITAPAARHEPASEQKRKDTSVAPAQQESSTSVPVDEFPAEELSGQELMDALSWVNLDEAATPRTPQAPAGPPAGPEAQPEPGPAPEARPAVEHSATGRDAASQDPASGDTGLLSGVPAEKNIDEAGSEIPAVGGIPIQLPPYTLLDLPQPDKGDPLELEREVLERVTRIDETLSNFRLEGRVVASVRGPTVTRFEVEPAPGEKISRFSNLSDDLALAMAVGSVRIEAPIPGKSVIGLEVPNAHRDLVRFREAAEAPSYKRTKARLPLILGKSIDGELVVGDLSRMPHLLIAGSTGSGKSVAVNTLIGSLLYKFLPTELRFLMIDPKMVELTPYDGIPHLLRPVVTNPGDAAAVLLGAVSHMERRYKMMSKIGAKNLDQYNEKALNLDMPALPFIVIIIDELADLMITSPKEVESAIMRLAQMARATGMHLVLATQRPSVDILTSLIKVNVPARMAFAVSSGHDSRTILDAMGAERLVGLGDMLYYQPGLVKAARLQGPFISETEISTLAGFLRRQYFDDEFVEAYGEDFDPPSLHESHADGFIDWNDEKLRPAAELVIQEGQASVSRLQRRLQVGHARAGKLMDSLENLGVVGPHSGSKPRDVLVAFSELPNIFGK